MIKLLLEEEPIKIFQYKALIIHITKYYYLKKSGISNQKYENEKLIFDFEFNSKYKMYDSKPTKRVSAF